MKGIIRLLILTLCFTAISGFGQNAPVSIAGSVVSLNETAIVPVYALNFTNISSCNLKLTYDPSVASATAVIIGSAMSGMISTDLTISGEIYLGWFTSQGINLPDSSVIFNIHFSRTGFGNSFVNWVDDSGSCEYNDGNFEPLNDLPTDEYYQNGSLVFQNPDGPVTRIADVSATPGNIVNLPVTVNGFQMIGALSLQLYYDDEALNYLGFEDIANFPGLSIDASQPGNLLVSGYVSEGDTAITLLDQAILFSLDFNYTGGFAELNWIDNGTSCQYQGALPVYPLLNDTPQEVYYQNGSVSENALPLSAGPISGPNLVCTSAGFFNYSIEPIAYASAYAWQVPEGAFIVSGQNTYSIQVNLGTVPGMGTISVHGENEFGNGSPSSLEVEIMGVPASAGPVSGEQQVCPGQDEVIYTIQPVDGAITYNWFLPPGAEITSGDNSSAITASYGMNALNGSIMVFPANDCGEGMASPPLQVVVNILPQILTQAVSPAAVVAGEGTAIFAIQAIGTNIEYQWQEFTNIWSDLTESELYVGVNEDTLHIINASLEMNGNRYRCHVSGLCEPPSLSDGNAVLTVLDPVVVGNIPKISGLTVFPNPFQNNLELTAEFPEKGNLIIELTDASGKSLLTVNRTISMSSKQNVRMDTSQIQPGFYLLSMRLESETNLVIATIKVVCSRKS